MSFDTQYIVVIAALVSGFFAFVGAVAGQFFNRHTQRETWLLQRRSDVFAKFVMDIDEYNKECLRIYEIYEDDLDGCRFISAALGKLILSQNIVCFYLSDSCKKEFRSYVNKLIKFEPEFTNIDPRNIAKSLTKNYEPFYEIQDNIQNLFERNLSDISWYK